MNIFNSPNTGTKIQANRKTDDYLITKLARKSSKSIAIQCLKHTKCCDKFFVLTMSLYTFISLLFKQLLQYTLLKTFTVPSVLLTKFAKKFQTKLLASAFDFTKLSTKTLLLWRCHVSFEYRGLLQNTPPSFLLFLSMLKLHCKRHYRNLATYSWCTTRREHVTKTAPARRQHSVGGGGAAAAAHSSTFNSKVTIYR